MERGLKEAPKKEETKGGRKRNVVKHRREQK